MSFVPVRWKLAWIRPVPKVSTPTQHSDYRPISITPVFVLCDETQSPPLLIYFMSGVRPFYSVAMKQTIVRAHIVRA